MATRKKKASPRSGGATKAKAGKKVTAKKPDGRAAVAKKAVTAKSAKKVVKKASPAKKPVAKKAPATKASAQKAPSAKQPVAKKVPAKKTLAEKAPARKVQRGPAIKRTPTSASKHRRAVAGPPPELMAAAERATKGAFRVKPAERVLLVTDKQKLPIAEAFAHWFHHVRADTTTYLMVDTLRPIVHIPVGLRRLAEESDLTVYVLDSRSEEMQFRRELVEAALVKGRVCMMPGITTDMMSRLVNLNYAALQDLGQKIVVRMSGAREVRVTNELGTDVTFSVFGRRWLNDSGDIAQRGLHGNLPAGECFTAPVEETFKGVVHFSLIDEKAGKGMARFEKGRLVEYKGRGISAIVDLIGRDPGGKVIGEIGIGTNRNAQLGRNLLESEKAYGAIHFGLGDSHGLGSNRSKHHYDMLVEKATVVADGEVVLENGEFKV